MRLTTEDLGKISAIVYDVVNDAVIGMKSDFDGLKTGLDGVKTELAKKADKTDLDRMELRLVTAMGLVERDYGSRLVDLEVRVDKLERVAS